MESQPCSRHSGPGWVHPSHSSLKSNWGQSTSGHWSYSTPPSLPIGPRYTCAGLRSQPLITRLTSVLCAPLTSMQTLSSPKTAGLSPPRLRAPQMPEASCVSQWVQPQTSCEVSLVTEQIWVGVLGLLRVQAPHTCPYSPHSRHRVHSRALS